MLHKFLCMTNILTTILTYGIAGSAEDKIHKSICISSFKNIFIFSHVSTLVNVFERRSRRGALGYNRIFENSIFFGRIITQTSGDDQFTVAENMTEMNAK